MAVIGETSLTTQDTDAGVAGGPVQFEIEEDREGIEGDSDFEE